MPLSHGSVGPEGVTCPYHGCRFSADGTGYCPTTRSNRFKVPVFETRTLHDVVWVRSRDAANAAAHDLAADSGLLPELAEDDHAFACVVAKDIAAPLQLVVDNMTELEHTGLVHKQLAFGIDDFDTVETSCQHDDEGVTIFYRGRQRPLPLYLSLLSGLRRGDVYVQTAARIVHAALCCLPPLVDGREGRAESVLRPSLRELLHRGRRQPHEPVLVRLLEDRRHADECVPAPVAAHLSRGSCPPSSSATRPSSRRCRGRKRRPTGFNSTASIVRSSRPED